MSTPPTSLQESILAVLAFRNGGASAALTTQVLPSHFDEDFRSIAEKVLSYRRKYGKCPGRAHIDDLLSNQSSDRDGRPSRSWHLMFDLSEIADQLNPDFVLSQASAFVQEQNLKVALIAANSRWEQGGEARGAEIEAILHKALKIKADGFDAGLFLNNPNRALSFLDRFRDNSGIPFGIAQFDEKGLRLRPKEMTLYIGPKGTGKTWAAVHVGRQAIMLRKNTLHITCEVSEEIVAQRYFQNLLSAATSKEDFTVTDMDVKGGKVVKMYTHDLPPKIDLSEPGTKQLLLKKTEEWEGRQGHLVIKEFASGTLTIGMLESYLDYLDFAHKFQPDLLIVDYPDLMKQDSRFFRLTLGQTFVDLRGLLKQRNMAGFFPTQGNRSSLSAKVVKADMVAEDITKVNTADTVITYSRTEDEEDKSLARLYVANARNVRDGFTVAIAQSYATGQFVRGQSYLMGKEKKTYWDAMKSHEPHPDED